MEASTLDLLGSDRPEYLVAPLFKLYIRSDIIRWEYGGVEFNQNDGEEFVSSSLQVRQH